MSSHDRNLELEAGVLSCVMAGDSAGRWAIVCGILPHALCFAGRDHMLLYLCCAKCTDEGREPSMGNVADVARSTRFDNALDELSLLAKTEAARKTTKDVRALCSRLRVLWQGADALGDSVLAAAGGYAALAALAESVLPSQLEQACRRLFDYYRLRAIRSTVNRVMIDLDQPDAVDRVPEHCAHIAESITTDSGPTGAAALGPSVEEWLDTDDEMGPEYGSWGFSRLDGLVPPRRNAMTVLSAKPGQGKTSLALQCARATAKEFGYAKGCVAIVSLEMDRDEIMWTMLGQELGIQSTQIEKRDFSQAQANQMREQAALWKDSILVSDGMITTGRDICQWARSWRRRNAGAFMLIVDHLNVLGAATKSDKEYDQISENTKLFYRLRKELDIHILALCQMNRDLKGEPALHNLRGSGSIEQDATSVVFLHCGEPELDPRPGVAIVSKNRRGQLGRAPYYFHASRGQVFKNDDHQRDPFGISKRYEQPPSDSEDLFG